MSEYRIAYNIFDKDYTSGSASHTVQLYNAKKQKKFGEYIRGIILDNILYLRIFYPFDDIDSLSSGKLRQLSFELLKQYISSILEAVKKHDNIDIIDVKYNYDNDLFKKLKLANI